MPDYAKAATIFSGYARDFSDVTIPVNGMILMNWHTTHDIDNIKAYINGILIGTFHLGGGTCVFENLSFPVAKGDVVRISGTSSNGHSLTIILVPWKK